MVRCSCFVPIVRTRLAIQGALLPNEAKKILMVYVTIDTLDSTSC